MGNYGRTSGTGGPGSSAITNDDDFTLDLPDDTEEDPEYADVKDERSY